MMLRTFRRSALFALTLALLSTATVAATPRRTSAAATQAITYVASTQAEDGGFFGRDQAVATSGGLADTLVATAVAAGLSVEGRAAAMERLSALAPNATARPAYTGRIVMAIVAAGGDPRSFGGIDYAARLAASRSVAGWWETQNYANALAALGWAALGNGLALESSTWIRAQQCADGGWGFMAACLSASDVDTTALTINALIAGGIDRDDVAVQRARQFLLGAQNGQGGFGDRPGAETNANSTGLALSAIAALGEQPQDAPWDRGGSHNPLAQLLSLQTADGGFLWKASRPTLIDNYATVQAIPGVAGAPYPIRPTSEDGCGQRPGRRVGPCPRTHPRR